MAKFKNLRVWHKAHQLALDVYRMTSTFPRSELFGLTAQIRRAAFSVPANIAEGYGRKTKKELSRFIDIALGSLAETEYLVLLSKDLGYANNCEKTDKLIEDVGSLLWSFQKRL